MDFYQRLMNLDRRWVYLVVGIAVIIPVLNPFRVPVYVTPEVEVIHDFVKNLKPGDILFLAIDYDPQAMAEVHPMAKAIMRQCFAKNVKLIISALSQNGPGMAEQLISEVAKEFNKKSGIDYCYLGYKPYPGIVILAMGQNFRIPFPTDYYGVPLDSLPMMRDVRNYDDVKAVIDISATNAADFWIINANGRYDVKLALGVTGVMTANYYPYLQSGQIFGLMGGLKGASEYEALSKQGDRAIKMMSIQTTAHIVIVLFIVAGNIGYFMSRKKKKQ
ncbi:MAG: hypothetical protein AMJ73_05650 [candidate division Zixibacteria bacterium SM1_73]|nr:MAG: hypothetical protein AMJ73_05650 [candidate division Zixibacteria bacterium SM1_73]